MFVIHWASEPVESFRECLPVKIIGRPVTFVIHWAPEPVESFSECLPVKIIGRPVTFVIHWAPEPVESLRKTLAVQCYSTESPGPWLIFVWKSTRQFLTHAYSSAAVRSELVFYKLTRLVRQEYDYSPGPMIYVWRTNSPSFPRLSSKRWHQWEQNWHALSANMTIRSAWTRLKL